jgi:hypothetical protein
MNRPTNLFIPVAGLSLALCIISWPILTTLAWHLRYGSHIASGGKTFDVPWSWQAKIEGRKVRMTRLPYTALSNQSAMTTIFFWPVPSPPKGELDKESAYKSFADVYRTYLAGNPPTVIKGPERRGTGEKELVCMEARPKLQSRGIILSCLAFRGTWYATLYGNQNEVDAFYEIIQTSK